MTPSPASLPPSGLAAAVGAFKIAGRTIDERIAEGIADGRLVQFRDGRLGLSADDAGSELLSSDAPTIPTKGTFSAPCRFLNHFLFTIVYGEAQVPYGCRACYKIWIHPESLRALFALKEVMDATPYTSKIKVEALNQVSPNVYLGIVYGGDLAETRAIYHAVRTAVTADERLGAEVRMEIRRGCQNYERLCGPSDRYSFDPALESVEAALLDQFVRPSEPGRPKAQRDAAARLRMVQIAHQLGDESYKDFTGGKSLSISPVQYAPGGDMLGDDETC
ncbi:MAG: hypothetical protein WCS75_09430 [Sphingomonas sp.]|uniref:hypothetical protein n=1 Tax=Sphingomonas sp. TaxID=28214 RepID=UPI00356AE44C